MKRDIRFRGWSKMYEKMFVQWDMDLWTENRNLFATIGISYPERPQSDEGILMQFTGLQTKTRTDVYEGDIIKFIDLEGSVYIGCIGFEDTAFTITLIEKGKPNVKDYLLEYMDWFGECADIISNEVIGNIYENPDLIEK